MKGDFTRITFRPDQRYTGVRMQQGRVQLDADWNEQADIQTHLDRTEATDTIGTAGAPKAASGFEVARDAGRGRPRPLARALLRRRHPLRAGSGRTSRSRSFPSATTAELEAWPDGRLRPRRRPLGRARGGRRPAELRKVAGADETTRVLTLDDDVSAFDGPANARLRPVDDVPDATRPARAAELTAPGGARTDLVYLDVWEQRGDGGRGSLPPRAGARRRRHGHAHAHGLAGARRGGCHGHRAAATSPSFPPAPSGARLTAAAPPSSGRRPSLA